MKMYSSRERVQPPLVVTQQEPRSALYFSECNQVQPLIGLLKSCCVCVCVCVCVCACAGVDLGFLEGGLIQGTNL